MPGGIAIYDTGNPYGPFQCTGCGAVYDELTDTATPTSGPISGWKFEYQQAKTVFPTTFNDIQIAAINNKESNAYAEKE